MVVHRFLDHRAAGARLPVRHPGRHAALVRQSCPEADGGGRQSPRMLLAAVFSRRWQNLFSRLWTTPNVTPTDFEECAFRQEQGIARIISANTQSHRNQPQQPSLLNSPNRLLKFFRDARDCTIVFPPRKYSHASATAIRPRFRHERRGVIARHDSYCMTRG